MMAIVVCTTGAWSGGVGDAVEVRIVTDQGRTLPTYPVKMHQGVHKACAEAVKADHYRIEVKNLLNRRVGLVIAVDGRNIISGTKSWLRSSEHIYILDPYGSGEYSGCRTAQNRINRFFFTDVPDSYAAAFGDESAMGVIAVAFDPLQAGGRRVRRTGPPPAQPLLGQRRLCPSTPAQRKVLAGRSWIGFSSLHGAGQHVSLAEPGYRDYPAPQAMTGGDPLADNAAPADAHNRNIADDDAGFVARCRNGDTEAFAVLVRSHQKKMLNVAFRMIGDYDEACDVVQEAFLSAYRAIGQFH